MSDLEKLIHTLLTFTPDEIETFQSAAQDLAEQLSAPDSLCKFQ